MTETRRRRASLGHVGDTSVPGVLIGLRARVQTLLQEATQGRVHIENVEHLSFETEFVLSSDSLHENNYNALMRHQQRCLGVGWTLYADERSLPVNGMPSTTHFSVPTLIVQYKSRALVGWSFPRTVCTGAASSLLLIALTYYLYWLLFVLRATY